MYRYVNAVGMRDWKELGSLACLVYDWVAAKEFKSSYHHEYT